MRNEKDRQEKYLNYFDQNQQNSQRNQSRRQQEQTQWFSPEDDEDMKLADDSFDEEDDFDPAPPRKRRRQSKLSRFAQSFVLICVFVGVAVFLAYFALVTASDLLGLGQTDQQIEVTLTEEDAASLSRTADVLEQNGVISSKLVFELYARLKDMEGTFQAKTFVLNNKWGYDQIMNHLAYDSEESDIVTVTFREGMTQQQIGELLEENNVCTAEDFYDALENGDYSDYNFAGLVPDEDLRFRKYEGYIFPDTYEFYTNMNAEEVVRRFFDNFDTKVDSEVMQRIRNLSNGLGERDNLITLASIIQREATDLENMRMVSSVFHNRLNNSSTYPYLQSDATTNYIQDDIRPFMTEDNQEMYDAYDTTKVVGLPVGPICNPGMDAIEAAIDPAETDYYYFVSDDAGNRTRVSATVTAGSAESAFADTANHWSGGYASQLYARGVMQGELDSSGRTCFNPDRNLTRQEFAVTIARLLGLDTSYTGEMDFADDNNIASWARGAVYAVSQAGIMQGSSSGGSLYFEPNAEMTRAEVMTVIGRCLPRGYASASLSYSDASSIPSWARDQVQICVSAGIISGYEDNTLRPLGNITRGEIAKILAMF